MFASHPLDVGSPAALVLLSREETYAVLAALEPGPRQPCEVDAMLVDIAHTTVTNELVALAALGLAERQQLSRFPNTVTYELTADGHALCELGDAVAALARTVTARGGLPVRPAQLAKAIDAGWSTSILQLLGHGALRRCEMERRITTHSCHQLRPRLACMERGGLVVRTDDPRPSYALTAAAPAAIGLVLRAVRWEGAADRPVPIAGALLARGAGRELAIAIDGVATCTVEASDGSVGVCFTVEGGRIVRRAATPDTPPTAWLRGTPDEWLAALLDGRARALTVGGDRVLARALVALLAV